MAPTTQPIRKLFSGVLASLVVAGSLALLAPVEAAAYRVGVVSGIVPGEADLDAMQGDRARSVRVNFSWDLIEIQRRTGQSCSTALYDFSRHDDLVRSAGQRRLSIMPTLSDAPSYVGFSARYPAPGTAGFQDFRCFVRALVGRYGRGGSFGARDITEWQLWNEVNLPLYSPNKKVSPRKYGRLVKATAASIRREDSRARIILAGLPEQTTRGMNANTFLRKLYRVNGIRRAFDAVAIHPYARNARGVKGALIRVRRTLRDLRDRRRALWLTEIGWATNGRPENYFLVTSEKAQARKLATTFRMLRENRRRFKLGTVHWFRFRDLAPYSNETAFWPEFAGLYRKSGRPKPACHRYRRITGAGGRCTRISSVTATSSSLTATEQQASNLLVPSAPE